MLPNIKIDTEPHTTSNKIETKPHTNVKLKTFLYQEAQRMREKPTEGEILFKNFCDRYNITYAYQKPAIVGYKGFIIDFEIVTKGNTKLKGFNTSKRKIAVEIDGEYHNTEEQKEKDSARSKTLNGAMYKVIRFTNDEVKDDLCIIRKFQEFLPKIKETTLLKKFAKWNNTNLQEEKEIETLTKLLVDKDKEIMYWKDEYLKLYRENKKLKQPTNF